jgi:hypothetical protein
MTKPFDAAFFTGTLFVLLAFAVAYAALTNSSMPIVGSGRGALVALAVLAMAGCAVGGISQATALGWSHPFIVLGSLLGVIALLVVGAGLFGWDGLLRPVVQLAPGNLAVGATTERLAILLLTALIALKWVVDVIFAVSQQLSPA